MKKYRLPGDGGAVSDHVEVEIKKTNFKEFEESILKGDAVIKESYPLKEKGKMTVCYTVGIMTWRGDAYESAIPEITYCCEDAKALRFGNNNIDPVVFKKVLHDGKPVDGCPFCGAEIEIKAK